MANKKKYPIGTKIRFVADEAMRMEAQQDNGKIGVIVGYMNNGGPIIFLENSVHRTWKYNGKKATWKSKRNCIKLLENQQLMFAFME